MLWLRLGAERRLWRKRKRFLDLVVGKALLLERIQLGALAGKGVEMGHLRIIERGV
jgi:hypothetical protein